MLKIDPEFRSLIPPLTGEERRQLEANIVADGCRDPLVAWEGTILDGHNRYEICEARGIAFRAVEQSCRDRDEAKVWIIRNQFGRRNLQPYQRGELQMALERLLPNRQGQRTDLRPTSVQIETEVKSPTRAAADLSGLSHSTYAKVKVIAELAPEPVKEQLRKGELSIDRAYQDIRGQERRRERVDRMIEISRGNAPLATPERYPVLCVDPPWRYEFVETDNRTVENHYPTLNLDEICALPVADIATPDAVLFCWATSPKLAEAMRVLAAWGFTYRTCMVWVKDQIGMGYYARQQHELLLIATRGEPPAPRPGDRPASVVQAPRGAHSAKPDLFYDLIARMYPELPRIELYARKSREGWFVWGNQVPA